MTTDATRANAQAMPLTRRRALATTGAGILAALSPAPSAISAEADSSLAALCRLLDALVEARAINSFDWDVSAQIENRISHSLPNVRVQVGRVLKGRDDEGNNIWEPMYAYTPDCIERHYQREEGFCDVLQRKGTPGYQSAVKCIRQQKQEKLDELAALRAEAKRIEDDAGYTAACDQARATSQVVTAIESDILAFVPGSLAAAARLASWVSSAMEDGFLNDEGVAAALASIGKAVRP